MKRPQHMTMRELIGLPILDDGDGLSARSDGGTYGGAFRDEHGLVWGTLRTPGGWVRYPAYLFLLSCPPRAPALEVSA